MRFIYLKETLKSAVLAMTVLLATAGVTSAQTVNLTSSQQTTTTPDGNTIPMWGWNCGATAAGGSTGGVASITVTNGGAGYAAGTTVTFSGGGGTGAAGTVSLNAAGTITAITVTNPGSGYTSAPTLTFSSNPTTAATFTVNFTSVGIAGFTVNNGGAGYAAGTTVTISGGGGTGAAATVSLNAAGTITAITVTNPGSGYTTPPTLTFSSNPTTAGTFTVIFPSAVTPACTALTYNVTTTPPSLNPQGPGVWQPPLIVVPYTSASGGASTTNLTINLTNTLPVETSIMLLGQAGGGLGGTTFGSGPGGVAGPVRESGPRTDGAHAGETATTWTIVAGATFNPPSQAARVRSMVPEVAGVTTLGTAPAIGTYTWTGLKPGTYLIRTGTYPSIQGPMGLYGVLVVTQAPTTTAAGTAYPSATTNAAGAVTYDADVVALESEIDARQNNMVAAAFSTSTSGTACTAPNTPPGCVAVGPSNSTTLSATFSEVAKWNLQCGAGPNGLTPAGTPPTCYPPAVDYTPMYFLFNGVAFNKNNQALSALSVPAPSTTTGRGNVLVRFVNAGSHMHTPSVNGLNMLLVAEDANVLPDVALALGATTPKALSANPVAIPSPCTETATPACGLNLRTEVFQPAGKVMDVIVSPGTATATYMIYDRALEALTTNNSRDGGMQAVLDVADAGGIALAGLNAAWTPSIVATGPTYTCVPGVTLSISDAGKGVIGKGTSANIYGVTLAGNPANNTLTPFGPTGTTGSLTLNSDGTFTYKQAAANASCGGTFTYYANNQTALSATATITQTSATNTTIHANPDSYTSQGAGVLRVGAPGVLGNDFDTAGYPLCAAATAAASGPTHCPTAVQTITGSNGETISLFADGSFTAVAPANRTAATTSTFTYVAANSQGAASGSTTVTLNFPAATNLSVTVQDAPCVVAAGKNATATALAACAITDYKWIIEQDRTFPINPACQVNTGGTAASRPAGCAAGLPPTPATNFHTSFMPVIAEGCTGPQSCGRGQTVYDPAPNCATTTPVNAPGCSPTGGQHVAAACDGSGNCIIGATQLPVSLPSSASLTATNPDGSPASYYISILSGDSQNAFAYGNVNDPSQAGNCTVPANMTEPTGMTTSSKCGHTMGGAPIRAAATCTTTGTITCTGTTATGATVTCTPAAPATGCVPVGAVNPAVVVNLQMNPLPTATVTAFVFEDDYPLNGEPDTGGGIDALATIEKPLGDFSIMIWDTAGGIGDFTGQMTYDMFNMPLTNALNGTIDPSTGFDACPISNTSTTGGTNTAGLTQNAGVIMTCPQYESDGKTPSPLTGQVVVKNLMMGKFSLIAHPGAAREAAGEEWLQTNSLDGGHFLDSFIKPGEPPYFAEFGPGGYHVFFGFANPAHINARLANICGNNPTITPAGGIPFAKPCQNTLNGQVTNLHQDRSPSEELWSGAVFPRGNSGNYAPISYTNCYAAIGDTDGMTIALAKCDPDGNFTFTGLPDGDYGLVLFDQWDDFIVDGSSHQVHFGASAGGTTLNVTYPTFTWQAHLWSRLYMDTTGQGSPNLLKDGTLDPLTSPGLIQVPTRIRHANGKIVNTLLSDIGGNMRFDETFPLFAFYTVESDNTRFRTTGVHVVNDNGGQVDGPAPVGNGNTGPYQGILNSNETFSLPGDLSFPGAVYCPSGDAACLTTTLLNNATGRPSCGAASAPTAASCQSTGRIDPGSVDVEGWQGGVSEFDMLDWGKQPYYMPANATAFTIGENGGIRGRVVNNTTRNFDDIRMQIQNLWEPLVPNVRINLYQEGFASDGVTPTLTLVDSTLTTSWDDWAQGFHAATAGGAATIPNMSCTGQDQNDPFFSYTLAGSSNYLTPGTTVPHNSQYKCYDGYHNLNQIQPAVYDGVFKFPSQACLTGTTFTVPGGTAPYNCATIANPAFGVAGQTGAAAKILPPGKYVNEVVLPNGWQVDKEEDLNLLIGDQYIAPVTSQFTGLGAIFITPDQASLNAANTSYTGPYTAALNGNVGGFTIVSGGAGYAVGNPLVFTGGGGSSAAASVSAVSATGAITGISLTNGGSGYTSAPTVTVTSAGTGASLTAVMPPPNGTSGAYTPPWTCTGPPSAPSTSPCTLTPSTTNNGKQSTDYGRTTFGVFAPGALQLQSAPCVGRMRIVPDYLSISPESGEVAPFAGSLRPLCDRKEITLSNQMQANLEFNIYTNTPKTTSFTGFISDDFSSEFDPASPAFGEKFAVPNVPVSIRDFNGQEVSRVYSDQFGTYNGLVYSSWEVDPPNITGFSPNMMVTCMNDPGPIPDPNNPGQTMNDPLWNPAYSTFCYENPFMPGDTTYLDTPVIPVSAFAEGYNPPDCAYPDGTPMILSVLGDQIGTGNANARGPWVSLAGHNITICALAPTTPGTAPCPTTASAGMQVPNNAYSGPAATTAPFNQKFVTRHYGFGAGGTVTIGGMPATGCSWSDAMITCPVPNTVPQCPLLQTNASNTKIAAQCGELVITKSNGQQSIDTVTVTIGGGTPTFVAGEDSTGHAIQNAIDKAKSGDLIIVGCAGPVAAAAGQPAIPAQNSCSYTEMLLMWKPVRLQGIGDGAVTINASAHPAGKLLQPWRRQVNCLFGLAINGGIVTQFNPFDPNSQFVCPTTMAGQVDALVGEPILGWSASLNGNLAELLQEPTLMGAYEGAGITVLARGLENGGPQSTTCTVENAAACIPLNSCIYLTTAGACANPGTVTTVFGDCNVQSQFYGGNFLCNPSRIDGLTFTNSSQGGGGVYLHAFNHNTEVSNLNVTTNGGTLTGGITIGQMETVSPNTTTVGTAPNVRTVAERFGYNQNVNIHNNRVTNNAAYGDELNSNTPSSAGGVTLCTGADNYLFQYNWVCGNWSSGDGGGIAHHGFTYNGTIQNNWILFNQSINPSLVTNGGGLVVLGAKPDGTLGEAGTQGDVDVAPDLTDGTGPNLVIRNNVFQGNTAEEGQGGGVAFLNVNGNDVVNNPSGPGPSVDPNMGTCLNDTNGAGWYCVTMVDNIIANNVAGWDGGGVSVVDAILLDFRSNTVVSNDATASAGVVFNSNGAPLGNVPPPGCNPSGFGCAQPPNCGATGQPPCSTFGGFSSSTPLPAGLVTERYSHLLFGALATFRANNTPCPVGHRQSGAGAAGLKLCGTYSIPLMNNDIFWQNRSFSIAPNAGAHNAVALSPNLSQTATGGCPGGASYWDIGVYSDSGPTNHGSGLTLQPTNSVLSSGGYTTAGNSAGSPGFTHQYCNGSRVPPEIAPLLCTTNANGNANAPGCIYAGAVGIQTNGGVPDASVPPGNTINSFSITTAATIDEGSNWINMFYGPLSPSCMITTSTGGASTCGGVGTAPATNAPLGNYRSTNAAGAKSFPTPGYPQP